MIANLPLYNFLLPVFNLSKMYIFSKLFKVKARRLGQRGQSRYCYANIRRKTKPDEPMLPSINSVEIKEEYDTESFISTCGKLFGVEFKSLEEVGVVMSQQSPCLGMSCVQEKVNVNGHGKVRCLQKRQVEVSMDSGYWDFKVLNSTYIYHYIYLCIKIDFKI